MLNFFRTYQRYIYIVITVVIVCTFSFFGTYNGLPNHSVEDPVAFTTVTGKKIKRSDLELLTHFLSTDIEDKILFGGVWGPNFLNDGVIKKDFLQTGIAAILAKDYAPLLKNDWEQRLEKEKKYTLYSHPEAQFISVETAWEYFIPGKSGRFYKLQQSKEAMDPEAIEARIQLFLDERNYPAPALWQLLSYQERQYGFVQHDKQLDHNDLFLFNHYSMEDWFGPKFLRLASEFIINCAKIAETRGYRVSDAEVFAALSQNAEQSFRQLSSQKNLSVSNSTEYLNEQLRHLRIDRNDAVKLWRDVMLFRRLFQDMGNSLLLAPFPFEKFNQYANQSVQGDKYDLPESLRIGSYRDLQKFEAYLAAVSKNKKEDLLGLPTLFHSPAELLKTAPELVQKQYVLEIAEVEKKDLQSKISLKELWDWQLSDEHWPELAKEFSDLSNKKDQSQEERFLVLDQLDSRTRMKVNTFSSGKIIDAHPEWIAQALDSSEPKQVSLGLLAKGGTTPFKGQDNREELSRLLDQAPLKEASPALQQYSPNGKNYYRITVLERAPAQEILTFAAANKQGILDGLVDKQLKSAYEEQKEKYQKSFADSKELVVEQVYGNVLQAIRKDAEGKVSSTQFSTDDLTASLRFYSYLRNTKERIKNFPDSEMSLVTTGEVETTNLKDQWKLVKKPFTTLRKNSADPLNKEETFAMAEKSWSQVNALPNGDLFFFFANEKGTESLKSNSEQINGSHHLLSDDAMRMLAKQLVEKFKEKNSISLSYMDKHKEDA